MAGLADSGGVDDGGNVLNVAREETVEEVDVCVSQVCEVLVLVDGSLLVLEQLEASLLLCVEALNRRRRQAVCAQVLADLNGVCRVKVGASATCQTKLIGLSELCYPTHDCLVETAGGWLWVMLAAGAGATAADEDMVDEVWKKEVEVGRQQRVKGRERLYNLVVKRDDNKDIGWMDSG